MLKKRGGGSAIFNIFCQATPPLPLVCHKKGIGASNQYGLLESHPFETLETHSAFLGKETHRVKDRPHTSRAQTSPASVVILLSPSDSQTVVSEVLE